MGKFIAATAGAALNKSILELRGSDPYLILEDANIDVAAQLCVNSRLLDAGQSCIGAKRFIIADSIYDEFTSKFISHELSAIGLREFMNIKTIVVK